MKKLVTLVFAMLLTCSLSFAQGTTGSTGSTDKPATDTAKKGKKAHKGGKKSKKGAGDTSTAPPPK